MAQKVLDISSEELRHKYIDLQMPMRAIAKEYNTLHPVVLRTMRLYGIPSRDKHENRKGNYMYDIPRYELYDKYVVQRQPIRDIVKYYGCCKFTVKRMLRIYGFPMRSCSESMKISMDVDGLCSRISKDDIYHMYVDKKMTVAEVAGVYSCSFTGIQLLMKRYGISRRKRAELQDGINSKISIKKKIREIKNHNPRFYDTDVSDAVVGDVRAGSAIGKGNSAYVLVACGACGAKRWVVLNKQKNILTNNLCRQCMPNDDAVREKRRISQEKIKDIMVENTKKQWRDMSDEKRGNLIRKWRKAIYNRPTLLELSVKKILDNLYPNEWKYVGGGDVIFGKRNPDFINVNGQKKIIEVFGSYWHGKIIRKECPLLHQLKTCDDYKEYGHDTLVIWDKEVVDIKRLTKILREFSANNAYLSIGFDAQKVANIG